MIMGLNLRCNVGPFEVLRSPRLELVSDRRAVLSRALLEVPDPEGQVWGGVSVGQSVRIRFGYRGEAALWHEWEGLVDGKDRAGPDRVVVHAVGLEQKLVTTRVTESFHGEPAPVVARRLLERTGLSVAEVDIPDDVLPHQVFSGVTVARAVKQIEQSLTRAFGHDLRKHALWLGADGLRWSAGDEPGEIYVVESASTLLSHTPPAVEGGMGVVSSVLLPGLVHSRKVRIRDVRLDEVTTVRVQEVRHSLCLGGNRTTIYYGADRGWG